MRYLLFLAFFYVGADGWINLAIAQDKTLAAAKVNCCCDDCKCDPCDCGMPRVKARASKKRRPKPPVPKDLPKGFRPDYPNPEDQDRADSGLAAAPARKATRQSMAERVQRLFKRFHFRKH